MRPLDYGELMRNGARPIRPLIDYFSLVADPCGEKHGFTHNGAPTRIVLRRDKISVGCSDVTVRALRQLLYEYDKRFGAEEVVLQP